MIDVYGILGTKNGRNGLCQFAEDSPHMPVFRKNEVRRQDFVFDRRSRSARFGKSLTGILEGVTERAVTEIVQQGGYQQNLCTIFIE